MATVPLNHVLPLNSINSPRFHRLDFQSGYHRSIIANPNTIGSVIRAYCSLITIGRKGYRTPIAI